MKNIITEVWTITPERAKFYLKNLSRDNRTINKSRVTFYANQMKEGQWQLNGETIIFSDKDTLLNGYHRMHAVIEAGVPIKFLVVRNVDEESFKTIDTGRSRNAADVYRMSNIPSYTNVAAIVRRYLKLCNRGSVSSFGIIKSAVEENITNSEMLRVYELHPDIFQDVNRYAACLCDKYRIYTASEIGGIICYLHLRLGYEMKFIYEFFNILYQYNLEEPMEFFPCKLLRERLIQMAFSNQRLSPRYKQLLLAKAWNLWRKGKNVKCLKIYDGEDVRFE